MVEVAEGTNALELKAEAGTSLQIVDISFGVDGAQAEDITLSIDRKAIHHFKFPSGWYGLAEFPASSYQSLYRYLRKEGLIRPIPVGEGETVSVTAPGADNTLEVVYDLYDAGDIVPNMYNGSKSDRYDLLQIISNSAAISADGDADLDQSDLDSEFPGFPGGEVVPGRTQMLLKGLFGTGVSEGTGAAAGIYTDRIKFLADREDIFDKDLNGLLYVGDLSRTTATAAYGTDHGRLDIGRQYVEPKIIKFDDPIVFGPGEEVDISVECVESTDGATLAAGEIKLGMIFEVQRI
jgi:hypothetical protein